MKGSAWQRRIARAEELAGQHEFAREILGFYIHVAGFQEGLHQQLGQVSQSRTGAMEGELGSGELGPGELLELAARFEAFLSLAETWGPERLRELSRELLARGQTSWSELLQEVWAARSLSDAQGLLALAFLQPYAEMLQARASFSRGDKSRGNEIHTSQSRANPIYGGRNQVHALCPFCQRKPGFGVLRPLGEGGARSLVCSFCLAEWEFRRIVCPGCGEENYQRLAVFTAAEFDHIRVESCETCKTYIKTIDLTKNGRAEPVVDELASAPLDLWARDHGFAKLQSNLLGL